MTDAYPKPVVGQTFYLVATGSRYRGGRGEARTCTVAKVGRKYFTVEYPNGAYTGQVEFHLETRRQNTNYSADYKLYDSREAYEDHREKAEWRAAFMHYFTQHGELRISTEQYREAAEILGITLPERADQSC